MREFTRRFFAIYLDVLLDRPVWIAGLLLAVVAGLSDLYNIFSDLGVGVRCLIWAVVLSVGIAFGQALRALLRTAYPTIQETREDLLLALGMAMSFAPLLLFSLHHCPRGLVSSQPNAANGLVLVFAVTLLLSSIQRAFLESGTPPRTPDRLAKRLEAGTDARIFRLSSSDHHVMVTLSDGQTRKLRLRLRDAILEVDQEPGFCVHRSHWVAEAAIASVHHDGQKELVLLKSGETLPIGPKYRKNLVEAGFISV